LFNSKFESVVFQNNSFFNTKIFDGHFNTALFIDTEFSNADLRGTTFEGVNMIGDVVFNCKNNEICN